MSIKTDVLNELTKKRGESVSGEELASVLGVSRTAIWKAVKSLKKEGYSVVAVTNKGYTLSKDDEVFTAQNIISYLPENVYNLTVEKNVSSTNDIAKELAINGAKEWTVVIADGQTAGRGRYGRKFYSPEGTGIYCSIVLRPKFRAADTLFITTSAAVAVAEAVEELTGNVTEIKWVNDIFQKGKKICGILTEASYSVESGGLDYAVLGFGLNVKTKKFPSELKEVAASVYPEGCTGDVRARLTAKILERFRYYYESIPERSFYSEYKRRSFVIGKYVRIISGNFEEVVRVIDIDANCFIKVKLKNGEEKTLSSGEISIKV